MRGTSDPHSQEERRGLGALSGDPRGEKAEPRCSDSPPPPALSFQGVSVGRSQEASRHQPLTSPPEARSELDKLLLSSRGEANGPGRTQQTTIVPWVIPSQLASEFPASLFPQHWRCPTSRSFPF